MITISDDGEDASIVATVLISTDLVAALAADDLFWSAFAFEVSRDLVRRTDALFDEDLARFFGGSGRSVVPVVPTEGDPS